MKILLFVNVLSLEKRCNQLKYYWHKKKKRSPKTTAQLIYCKTRTGYTYKLRVQDFATGKNFSSNQYPKQRVLLLFRESYLQKAIVNVFPVFAWADMNTLGAGRNLDSHKPSTSSRICITALNSSNPSSVYIRLCKQENCFLLLKYCFIQCYNA